MTAATHAAVGCAEAGHRQATSGSAIERAFILGITPYADDAYAGRGEQVVDVPAQGFLAAQVACDARLEVAPRRTRINVTAGGEGKPPEPSDGRPQRADDFDQ